MERRVLVIEGNVGVVAGVGKGLGERILEKNAGRFLLKKSVPPAGVLLGTMMRLGLRKCCVSVKLGSIVRFPNFMLLF